MYIGKKEMSIFQCQILVMFLANHWGSYWCHILVDNKLQLPQHLCSSDAFITSLYALSFGDFIHTHFTLVYVDDLQYMFSAQTIIL